MLRPVVRVAAGSARVKSPPAFAGLRPSSVMRAIRCNRPLPLPSLPIRTGSSASATPRFPSFMSGPTIGSGGNPSQGALLFRWRAWFAAMAGGALFLTALGRQADACGIVAVVGQEPAVDFLLEGLLILQNRGYDSAGCATVGSNGLTWTKYASSSSTSDCIDLLKKSSLERHPTDVTGIAHTRWATHGGKSDANAHPHIDHKGRVAIVHNGTIENSDILKKELQAKGIPFKSQTDTEVIAQMIGCYLDEGLSIMESVKQTLARLEGTWGLAVIHRDTPGQVIAARNGSPLVVGIAKDRHFIASEPTAFNRHTTQFISLKDGEVAVVKADSVSLDLNRVEHARNEHIEISPAPYPHWTIKEIHEQPDAIERTLGNNGSRVTNLSVKLGGLDDNKSKFLPVKSLVVSACGTSYFAGLYGMKLMQALRSFDSIQTVDASEVTPDTLPTHSGGVLVISQSGETKDTHRSLQVAEQAGLPVFSVVNQVGSLIARSTNCGVYLNAGREHAVASTKAFTTQVTALALIAGWFSEKRGDPHVQARREELLRSVSRLPAVTRLALNTHEQCKALAVKLKDDQHLFILGKGFAEPIAYEGALKIKEITYIHAEGYSGGALKHGPFALLDKGTPVILMVLDDQHGELMRIAAEEVRARGARTIVITDKPDLARGIADEMITIPSNGPMTALGAVIPLQLLAYELSLQKGFNPDKPRNLAKAVTVD